MLVRQPVVFCTVLFNVHMFMVNKHLLSTYFIPGTRGARKTKRQVPPPKTPANLWGCRH